MCVSMDRGKTGSQSVQSCTLVGRSLLNNSDQWKFQKSSRDVLKQGWGLIALAGLVVEVMS